MNEKEKTQIRKKNMKLFPICKALGWDYLFFYTVNFLFLTQVKNISVADVILIDSFYALFGILMEIPATFIIEYIGRKRSIVFANILNCLYMIVVMTSINLFNLIIAELLSSLAFAIKETSEPALLNSSIPPTKNKSKTFAKINQRGMSNYYILDAITTVIAGFLYDINPYIPIMLALGVNIFVSILSIQFEDLKERKTKKEEKKVSQTEEIKEAFKFILKSERLKSLILYASIAMGTFSIMITCQVSLLEDLNIEAKYLCIITALLSIISGIGSKKQEKYHNIFKNKSLSILLLMVSLSIAIAGIGGVLASKNVLFIFIILLTFIFMNLGKGIFNPLIERYLRNFANNEVDTQIFVAKNFLSSIFSAMFGLFASFLLDRMNTSYCMIISGASVFILSILISQYMKSRVGLNPENYPKEDVKYDELKIK